MSLLLLFGLTFILANCLTNCAMRKDLETPSAPPVIGGQSGGTTTDPDVRAASPDYSKCTNPNSAECTAVGTQYCQPDTKGKYPGDNIEDDSGMNSDGSAWAKGGGCVLRPIREVWAALNSEQSMKIGASDSYVMDHPNFQPGPTITNFYQVTYSKGTLIGSISWTMRWFHGLAQGTFDQPQIVEIVYQRVGGTPFMPVWDGKIILAWLNDNTTAFYINNHFRSVGQSKNDIQKDAEAFGVEMLGKARTVTPNWDNLNTRQ